MIDDAILRRAFAAQAEKAVPRDDCPEPGILFDATAGRAHRAQLEQILEHTVRCGTCAESWQLAVALDREMGQSATAAWSRSARMGFFTLAAAAALVLAVTIPVLMDRSSRPASTVWRSGERPTIESLDPDDQPMPRESLVLRWSEPAPGARYSLLATSEKLEPLISRNDLARPEFPVPAGALEKLPAGARVYWRVTATLPDGQTVISPTFIATLQ